MCQFEDSNMEDGVEKQALQESFHYAVAQMVDEREKTSSHKYTPEVCPCDDENGNSMNVSVREGTE